MKHAPACALCGRPHVTRRRTMCGNCCEAYDRARRRMDGSIIDIIVWAAGRARRFARKEPR